MSHVVLLETKPNPPFAIARQAANHRVTLITSDLASYMRAPSAKDDVLHVDRVIEVPDTSCSEALWPVIESLTAEEPIDAVLTLSDLHLVPTAEIAKRLGLRFARPDAVRQTRNKRRTREALSRAQVPQPRWVEAKSVEEAVMAARAIGVPVVVKPVDGISSFNASIAR